MVSGGWCVVCSGEWWLVTASSETNSCSRKHTIVWKRRRQTVLCLPAQVSGLRLQAAESKTCEKGNKNQASSRSLDVIGRLRTSATSPLMTASRSWRQVSYSSDFLKKGSPAVSKSFPGTISSSSYITNSRSTALSGRYLYQQSIGSLGELSNGENVLIMCLH